MKRLRACLLAVATVILFANFHCVLDLIGELSGREAEKEQKKTEDLEAIVRLLYDPIKCAQPGAVDVSSAGFKVPGAVITHRSIVWGLESRCLAGPPRTGLVFDYDNGAEIGGAVTAGSGKKLDCRCKVDDPRGRSQQWFKTTEANPPPGHLLDKVQISSDPLSAYALGQYLYCRPGAVWGCNGVEMYQVVKVE